MITSPQRNQDYDYPDDGNFDFCDWCDSPVSVKLVKQKRHPSGTDGTKFWCSTVCQEIVTGAADG